MPSLTSALLAELPVIAVELMVRPEPPPVELMVWFGHDPVIVTLVPATSPGVVVPVPPCATLSGVVRPVRDVMLLLAPFVAPFVMPYPASVVGVEPICDHTKPVRPDPLPVVPSGISAQSTAAVALVLFQQTAWPTVVDPDPTMLPVLPAPDGTAYCLWPLRYWLALPLPGTPGTG